MDNEYSACADCGEYYQDDDLYTVYDSQGNRIAVCDDCRSAEYTECDKCGNWVKDETIHDVLNFHNKFHIAEALCPDCFNEEEYTRCEKCDELIEISDAVVIPGNNGEEISLCPRCMKNFKSENALEMEAATV